MSNTENISAKDIARERAIALLKASGVKFVIVTESGERIVHGDIDVVERTQKKRTTKKHRPIGALVNYYSPYLTPLQPGDCAVIPKGSFGIKELRAAVSAWACHNWGAKSAITVSKDDTVEILRVM